METIYRSFNGVDFTNKEDCIKHERKVLQMIPELISQAREICDLNADCSDCIFRDIKGNCSPPSSIFHLFGTRENGLNETNFKWGSIILNPLFILNNYE